MSRPPLISVLTPVYDPPPVALRACIDSVLAQEFADWELILVDDASTDPAVRTELDRAAAADPRIRLVRRERNGGIAAASADALAAARGTFIALLDHDDLLAKRALRAMAAWIADAEQVDLLYSDEDKVDAAGRHYDAFRKPDWSPARLRSQMYTGHLCLLRRSLVEQVGGFRAGFDGSQDYDLVLRVSEQARCIRHVPDVLYHWRAVPASVAAGSAAKPYAFDAALKALREHCARTGTAADVEQVHPAGIYRLRRRLSGTPLVSIVIPTRGSAALIGGLYPTMVVRAVRSIVARSTYPNFEVVLVADRSTPPAVREELTELLGERLVWLWFDRPFNFSDKVNCGALAASGEYLLLLNDDTEVITPDWIEALLGPCQEPDVGMVGALLYFADGTVQHGGHCYARGEAGHIAFKSAGDSLGYFGSQLVEREASGVTAACALLPAPVFHQVGGLSMLLPNNFNDVDFSLKVTGAGYRIVWTPHARLYHYESKTRVSAVAPWEIDLVRRRWGRRMHTDPYWPTPA